MTREEAAEIVAAFARKMDQSLANLLIDYGQFVTEGVSAARAANIHSLRIADISYAAMNLGSRIGGVVDGLKALHETMHEAVKELGIIEPKASGDK